MSRYKIKSGRLKNRRVKCPQCHMTLDGWTGVSGKKPKPGDASMCAYCATSLIFTESLSMRQATPDEQAELRKHPTYALLQAFTLEMMFRKEPK